MLLNIISNFISIVVLKFILKLIIYILMILILGFGVIKGSMKFGLSFVLFIENDVVQMLGKIISIKLVVSDLLVIKESDDEGDKYRNRK